MDSRDCPVCFVVYDDPRCLPCGHSFCLKCISRIAGDRRNLHCPCCNGNVELDVTGAQGLPKNYSLSSVIQDLPSSTCIEHNKTFDMLCAECNVTICYKCIFGSHSGHKIEDIDVVFSERKGIITNLLESTKLWQSKIKEQMDVTIRSQRSMQEEANLIKSRINDTFEKWHDALEKRKCNCMEHLDEETGKRKKVFDCNMSICERVNTDINNLTTRMNRTLSEDKVSVLQMAITLSERSSHLNDIRNETEIAFNLEIYEKVRRENMQNWDVTFITPDEWKIGIHDLWMEMAVENIKLIDTRQTEESSSQQNLYDIIDENKNLKRYNIDLKQELEKEQREKRETELQRDRLTAYNRQLKEELENRAREERKNELQIDQLTACNTQLKEKLKKTKRVKSEKEVEKPERETTENELQMDQLKTSNKQLKKKLKKMKRENRENELTIDQWTAENRQLKEKLEKESRENRENELTIDHLTAENRQLKEELEKGSREKIEKKLQICKLTAYIRQLNEELERMKRKTRVYELQIEQLKTPGGQFKEELEKTKRKEDRWRRQLYELKEMMADISDKDESYTSRNDPTPGPFQILVWKSYISQLKEDLEKAIRIEQTRRKQLSEVQEMVSRILEEDEK